MKRNHTRLEFSLEDEKDIFEQMEKEGCKTKVAYMTHILEEIIDGNYDHVPAEEEEQKKSIYVDKFLAAKARNHAESLGFKSLRNMISHILESKK